MDEYPWKCVGLGPQTGCNTRYLQMPAGGNRCENCGGSLAHVPSKSRVQDQKPKIKPTEKHQEPSRAESAPISRTCYPKEVATPKALRQPTNVLTPGVLKRPTHPQPLPKSRGPPLAPSPSPLPTSEKPIALSSVTCTGCRVMVEGKFCNNCGTPRSVHCNSCREMVEGKFCQHCGSPRPGTNVNPTQPREASLNTIKSQLYQSSPAVLQAPPPPKPEPSLTISIDIGSQRTCIAYQKKGSENIRIVFNFPGQAQTNHPKNFSTLHCCEGQLLSWGFAALERFSILTPAKGEVLQHLKLDLMSCKTHLVGKTGQKYEILTLLSALFCKIREHMVHYLRNEGVDVDPSKFGWCFTLPATWSQDQENLFRRAAQKSKMVIHETHLTVIRDPEATLIFSLGMPDPPKGTVFIVDIGGSVDCSVYQIQAVQNRFDLTQLYKASGVGCGTFDRDMMTFLDCEMITDVPISAMIQKHSDFLEFLLEWEVFKEKMNDVSSNPILELSFGLTEEINEAYKYTKPCFTINKITERGEFSFTRQEFLTRICENTIKKTLLHASKLLIEVLLEQYFRRDYLESSKSQSEFTRIYRRIIDNLTKFHILEEKQKALDKIILLRTFTEDSLKELSQDLAEISKWEEWAKYHYLTQQLTNHLASPHRRDPTLFKNWFVPHLQRLINHALDHHVNMDIVEQMLMFQEASLQEIQSLRKLEKYNHTLLENLLLTGGLTNSALVRNSLVGMFRPHFRKIIVASRGEEVLPGQEIVIGACMYMNQEKNRYLIRRKDD